jgi:hypothetical protein
VAIDIILVGCKGEVYIKSKSARVTWKCEFSRSNILHAINSQGPVSQQNFMVQLVQKVLKIGDLFCGSNIAVVK